MRGPWLLLPALLLAGLLAAEDVPPEEASPPAPLKTQVTVVGSRLPIGDAGSGVRVLTREDIKRIPARSLLELLRTLPGLDVRRRGVEGVQADVGIRGADYNGTLFLVDGEPVNDPQSNHLSSDLDVPLDAIERVEVLYGAGAALYGGGAIGGVVNIVTRGANLGKARGQVEGRYGHGTNSLDAGSLRLAARLGGSAILAADASRAESSGFRDDTELSVNQLRVTGRLDTALGPVNLAAGYAGRSYGAYGFYGTAFPNQQETTRTRTARLSSDLTLGPWVVTPSLAFRSHADDYVLERTNPSFYENRHTGDMGAARVFARTGLWGGSAGVGVEAGRESIDSTNLGDHRRDHLALFLEFGRPFDKDAPEKGAFRLGLRGDRYEDFGSRLSPYASATVTVTSSLRLRASVGTAFRAPTFTELYYSDPQNAGNPGLRPEKAINVEGGAVLDLGPVRVDGALFYRHATDVIDYVRSSPSERFTARNVRRADTSGVESTLELDPRRAGLSTLTRLAMQATYVFTDLARLSTEADGATEGKYVLDPLHVRWDLIAGAVLPLELMAYARLSHARLSYADGVVLLEARLARQLFRADGDILEVYVEGDDLGNVHYQERPGVPLPGRTLFAGFHLTW